MASPEVAATLAGMPDAVLDGELIVPPDEGDRTSKSCAGAISCSGPE
jgi:hypothetical protein